MREKKKAERVEMKNFDEIKFLEELKTRRSTRTYIARWKLSVAKQRSIMCFSREKSFNHTIGTFQPVRYLFTLSGHYKFQVFIHRAIAEGKIDIESFAELSALLDKVRKTSD